jgi:D-tyrosyl-tRNA(Tyr) deacylase
MVALIQRVSHAQVTIGGELHASIQNGMLLLLGISVQDEEKDVKWLAGKVSRLRIFNDGEGKMNLDLAASGGDAMVISQFTLLADPSHGNRPSYILAARPEKAFPLYEYFLKELAAALGRKIASGKFGADMQVSLCNDGPVTLLIDTQIHMNSRS